ncbi:two-component regulator propeller domain-containing protein [Cesiribacter sp. SM1]|uniref:hybrid sensor histidine kinase/response regulator transcription factor n=1 Tax=Cesiribacter sp. SM1 TaxID=2861196 RepID=UPI001CD1D68C|nr:two-component regulator propeller domain-containing protein [Cesiribacter sp. SM1]
MRFKSFILFFVFLFLVGAGATAGLPEQLRFSLLDVSKGLSNNQVNCFLRDSRGYLWIGTADGLNRYDGTRVKVYQHNPRDSSSIRSNTINKLFEDPAGKLWVVTADGISIYDPVQEKFHRNTAAFTRPFGLEGKDVENIIKDKTGNYWFILTGQGVCRYTPGSGKKISLKHTANNASTISSNFVQSVAQNADGDYWLIHRNGIFEKLDGSSFEVEQQKSTISERFKGQLLNYELFADSDDDLWIYLPYETKGLFLYQPRQDVLTHYHRDSKELPLNNNMVRGVTEAQTGQIWIGTDHGGINIIDKKNQTVSYVLSGQDIENGLAHNSVNALYKDSDGIIWLGTYKKGLNYYHENIIRFQHYKQQTSVPGSLPFDDINRFAEDKNGNLWIGTNGGGLLYYNRALNTYTRYRHNPADPESISSDVIVSLLLDKNGTLWVGTYTGGLNRFDGKGFKHYKHDPTNPYSLPCVADNVWELFQDSRGTIWVGTMKGGLATFDPQKETFHPFPIGTGKKDMLSAYISAIAEDAKGNIWIGGNLGVEVIDAKTGEVEHYQNNAATPVHLGSNNIYTIHIDRENRVWVGTQEGLNLFDEEHKNFVLFTKENGLPHNTVLTILEDDLQNLWLSTPNGISNALINRNASPQQPQFIAFKNFSTSYGLQDNVFNENAALRTSSDEMIFGGPNGFNLFHPGAVRAGDKVPKLLFSDFQLFNKTVGIGDKVNGRVLLEESLSDTRSLTLKHDENVFSIEFTALNFLHPEKNRFRYMLEGFDRGWQPADMLNRRATYTNLDPGDYTFRVQASNNDGSWSDRELALNIAVLAPFWRTNTAYVFYLAIGFLALYISRRMELQKARMKFKLEQTQQEARQLHELDLMKIRFFTNVSHEFRTPLSLILAPLERLIQLNKEPEQQKQYLMIQRNAKRLLNLVNQLLDFRKLEVEGVNLVLSEGNIIKFIEESVHSFSDLTEKKNVSLCYHSEVKALQASFDMDKLEKILFNLLSNAFKFTPEGGEISVAVDCLDNDSQSEGLKILHIKVKDTGIGIPKEKQDKIFERFFRNDVPRSFINQGSGIGLAITREFVKIHGGTISVESEEGIGSRFTVCLPVKEICGSTANSSDVVESSLLVQPVEERLPVKDHGPKTSGIKPHILLVEDNTDFRFYLKDNLSQYFTITEAANGKEGWQKALSIMPDLIVSDLMMPELNGIELCRKIREDGRTSHIPFVLLTAHSAEEQKLKGLGIGASDYVTKPFNFEILLSRLKNLITQRQQMQQAFEKKISVETSEAEIVSVDDKLIQNAIRVVEEHLENPEFTVEMLSRELGVSRVYLYKKMVLLTGSSPVEFIRKIRLERAAQFLEKSQLTVAEVAYKVGFNNAKYFTKYFKQEYKVLPSMYAGRKK